MPGGVSGAQGQRAAGGQVCPSAPLLQDCGLNSLLPCLLSSADKLEERLPVHVQFCAVLGILLDLCEPDGAVLSLGKRQVRNSGAGWPSILPKLCSLPSKSVALHVGVAGLALRVPVLALSPATF